MAGEALIEGGCGRIDITRRAGRSASQLLGSHVQQGTRRRRPVTGADREAEVGQLADSFTAYKYVGWLVIAVHDTTLVRRRQS
jgi:hypothetical protein